MAGDRTLIQIRERSFLDLLDLALVVVRDRPAPIVVAAVAGVAPFAAFNAWLIQSQDVPFLVYVGLLLMEAPWATAPVTVVLGGLMFGERPTAGRVVRALVAALPSMVLYQVVLRGLLLATVVLYPVLPGKLTFLGEVILLERGRLGRVVTRCSTLSGRRGVDFFGQWVAQLVFGAVFAFSFWFGTGAALNGLTTSELTWDEPGMDAVSGARFHVALWGAVVFFAVARFLTYIDQRIRLEGWEVKLRLEAVGRAIEDSGRW